jgi:hypothetical protein
MLTASTAWPLSRLNGEAFEQEDGVEWAKDSDVLAL